MWCHHTVAEGDKDSLNMHETKKRLAILCMIGDDPTDCKRGWVGYLVFSIGLGQSLLVSLMIVWKIEKLSLESMNKF